jgi:hypothetical protein
VVSVDAGHLVARDQPEAVAQLLSPSCANSVLSQGRYNAMSSLVKGKDAVGMAIGVALSALGMAIHTVREFGYAGLFSLATGMIPVVTVQALLFLIWWLAPSGKPAAALALTITAIFQLVGGAIISVLPLPFLPFEPEQTLSHYLSHLVLGIAQIPLIMLPLRWRQRRRVSEVWE